MAEEGAEKTINKEWLFSLNKHVGRQIWVYDEGESRRVKTRVTLMSNETDH